MRTILTVIAVVAIGITLFTMATNMIEGKTTPNVNATLQAIGTSLNPNSPSTSIGGGAIFNLCDDDPSANVTDKPNFGASPNYESGVTYHLYFEDGIPSAQLQNGSPRYTVAQYLAAITNDGGSPNVGGGLSDSRVIVDPGIECDGKDLKRVGTTYAETVSGKINNSPFTASLTIGFDKGIECKTSITPTVDVTPTTPTNGGTPESNPTTDVVKGKEDDATSDTIAEADAVPKGAMMAEFFCKSGRLWKHISARKDKRISERSMSAPPKLTHWGQQFTDNKVMGYS